MIVYDYFLWIFYLKTSSCFEFAVVGFGSERVSMSIFYIYRRNESGWVAYMLGGPVPTTKLHECAEGKGEISRWRAPSNEPARHERRIILVACQASQQRRCKLSSRFTVSSLWSWNVSHDVLKISAGTDQSPLRMFTENSSASYNVSLFYYVLRLVGTSCQLSIASNPWIIL